MKKLALPNTDGFSFLETEMITFCESDGNYSLLHFEKKRPVLITKPLKTMEAILSECGFFRTHK